MVGRRILHPKARQAVAIIEHDRYAGQDLTEGVELVFFFLQAEAGIRDADVTGVQTCALPISPELKEKLAAQFYEPLGGTPERFAAAIRSDMERYSKAIRDAGIKPE